jgi:hypothetical protein
MKRLIDADAVIQVQLYSEQNETWEVKEMTVEDYLCTYAEMPQVIDAEPVRHGKWTVTPIYIKCSECGESFMLIPQNYCPNCGARMDAK